MTDKRPKVHQLARLIADHLPLGWRYSYDECKEAFYAILRDDSQGIRLRITDGRLIVTGMWPMPVKGPERNHIFDAGNHGYTSPRITCNPDREPAALARDIERRFLPDYLWQYEEMCRRRDAKIAELERLQQVLALFEQVGASNTEGRRAYFRYRDGDFPNGHVEVTVDEDGEKVAIDMRSIPLETALYIFAEIADCRQAIMTARREQT